LKPIFAFQFYKNYKHLLALLIVFSLFMNFRKSGFLGMFDLYWYYVVFVLVIVEEIFKSGMQNLMDKKYLILVAIIFVTSLVSIFINPYEFHFLIKQIAGFLFFGLAWIAILKINENKISVILNIYLSVAIIAAFFTIPEQILHQLDIHITPKKGGMLGMFRCYSFVDEPFPLSMLLLPWIIFYLERFRISNAKEKAYLFILLIAFFFTFSGAGWLAFLVYLIFKVLTMKQIVRRIFILISVATTLFVFFSYHGTRLRVKETTQIFNNFPQIPSQEILNATNSSSRSIYLNSVVAYHQLLKNPITGGGLGSHFSAYQTHIAQVLNNRNEEVVHLNQFDGASGFLRIMSEMGLVGFILLTLLLYLIFNNHNKERWFPVLFFWICFILHSGNYFHYGSIMWLVFLLHEGVEKKLRGDKPILGVKH
jgi:hypothetical protein